MPVGDCLTVTMWRLLDVSPSSGNVCVYDIVWGGAVCSGRGASRDSPCKEGRHRQYLYADEGE